MKKVLMLLLCCCFLGQLNGQSTKGDNFVGFTGLPIIYPNNSSGLSTSGVRGYALYVTMGRYFTENISLGVRSFFGKVKENDAPGSQIISAFGFNGFARLDVWKKKLGVFVDVNGGVGRLWYRSDNAIINDAVSELDGTMLNFAVGPGMNVPLGKQFELEILLQYLYMKNKTFPDATSVGNTLIPSVGARKLF